ncbi:T9SS type A sorting domain-containing protein [Winogradskyella endarachnes]|uniref:T9SS type A sorting domain-containing protein n=1 Tax=Winogradskyella endarachnes TaxID=2681965 RepID=A0A6L6UEY4_9FLAO|nr:T9SS type A sorting domain-containing protein [Winogradskyella endarachnes]MUU79407.1 T9SS type A sorting domain-containing protein [Winogradskyella endarachnes]
MKNKITLFCISLCFTVFSTAQTLEWHQHFGNYSEDVMLAVDTDHNDNTYTTGYFGELTAFDNITLTGLGFFNGFVTKTDSNGNVLWAKTLSQPNDGDIDPNHSVIPKSISVDLNGNVIVVGYFDAGDFDANPGAGEYILSSTNYEMFIVKLDTDGNFLWATSFGATDDSFESISDVGTDSNGDIYVTGFYNSTISIAHPAGTSSITSSGFSDIFVFKYASDGYYLWMYSAGGTDFDLGMSIDVTPSGDSYITGQYRETSTFYTPMFGTESITLSTTPNYRGLFALKLDTWGNYQNAIKVGEAQSECIGTAIAVDNNNNAYVTGYYGGILISNEGTSDQFSIDSDSNYEAFVAKVDFTNSNTSWINEIDGGPDSIFGYGIDIDSNNTIYATGFFSSTLTVGNYTLNKQTTHVFDSYLVKMNSAGEFSGGYQFGALNAVESQPVTVDSNDNIIIAGSFRETANISPFASETIQITSSGFRDNYLFKIASNSLLNIADNNFDESIRIYPNPVKDILNISSQEPLQSENYTIFDINGKSMLTGIVNFNNQINISHLNSGFYFLVLNGSSERLKILKK